MFDIKALSMLNDMNQNMHIYIYINSIILLSDLEVTIFSMLLFI